MRFADPTPPEVRDKMQDIFGRAEFRRSRSILERFFEWLGRLLRGSEPTSVSGGGWGGAIADIILWVVLILVAVALVWLVVHIVRNRVSPARKVKPARAEVEVEVERTAGEWASEAEQLEAAGRWKDAIRCRYRELVARLVDAGVAAPLAGRTTGELRQDVARGAPEVEASFSRATGLFELPWYADEPTGPVESEEFRTLAADVLERVP